MEEVGRWICIPLGKPLDGIVITPTWNWPLLGVRRCLCQEVKAFDLFQHICTSSWCSQQRQDVVYANHSLADRGLHGDDWYRWWLDVQWLEG